MRSVSLEWTGEGLRFTGKGVEPGSPSVAIDGDNAGGASPMQHLLLAAASCAAIDVVLILQKMRVALAGLSVTATGRRREEPPRRFEAIDLRFSATGKEVDPGRVERAVALSVEKYCSVLHSLAADIAVTTSVDVH